jgi:hypothetical protein
MSRAEATAFIGQEIERWKEVVKVSNAKLD